MAEKEYIEREYVLKCMEDSYKNAGITAETKAKLTRWLNKAPAVDVRENKRGRWILETEPDGKPYCFHCSVCDDDFHYIGITTKYNFCPNCGADMREES